MTQRKENGTNKTNSKSVDLQPTRLITTININGLNTSIKNQKLIEQIKKARIKIPIYAV
jgi:hypothetical protein